MINDLDIRILLLIIMRLTPFFVVSQVFFPKGVPPTLKIVFSLILSFIMFPIINERIIFTYISDLQYIFFILGEVLVGLSIGIFVNLLMNFFSGMGSLLDSQGGFSSAAVFDPMTNNSSSIVEKIFYWMSLAIFILLNGHHHFIKVFILSYEKLLIGAMYIEESFLKTFIEATLIIFKSSFMIVIPIVIILIFVDIILGIISKIIPKINLIVVSFPFKITVTLILIILSITFILDRFTDIYIDFNKLVFRIFMMCPIAFVFSDDKTEDPTPQKLKKTREEGNVAKSAFLISAVSLLGILIVILMGSFIFKDLRNLTIYFIRDGVSYNYKAFDVVDMFKIIMPKIFLIIIIPSVIFIVLSIISNIAQTGFLFTTKGIKPSFNELNPINNIKNIFSAKTLFDLFRDLIVVGLLCYFGYDFIVNNLESFFRTSNFRINLIFESISPLFISVFSKILMTVLIIGIFDFIIEKIKHRKKLKMTKQEVKEEFKQMEGDLEMKNKIKQFGRQLIMQNMMSNVKDSSVIITNPTHISIALRYKRGEDMAPIVVAKGLDHVAYRIKELAKENDIPIIENKYLARFIYKNVEIDSQIPEEIYKAVADILTYIYKLNEKKRYY